MKHTKSNFSRTLFISLGLAFTSITACHADDQLSEARELFADYRYAAGLAPLRQAAIAGNRDARRTLGLMLLHGEALYGAEVPANREEGLRWLRLAAADGCEVSKHVLAKLGNHRAS